MICIVGQGCGLQVNHNGHYSKVVGYWPVEGAVNCQGWADDEELQLTVNSYLRQSTSVGSFSAVDSVSGDVTYLCSIRCPHLDPVQNLTLRKVVPLGGKMMVSGFNRGIRFHIILLFVETPRTCSKSQTLTANTPPWRVQAPETRGRHTSFHPPLTSVKKRSELICTISWKPWPRLFTDLGAVNNLYCCCENCLKDSHWRGNKISRDILCLTLLRSAWRLDKLNKMVR